MDSFENYQGLWFCKFSFWGFLRWTIPALNISPMKIKTILRNGQTSLKSFKQINALTNSSQTFSKHFATYTHERCHRGPGLWKNQNQQFCYEDYILFEIIKDYSIIRYDKLFGWFLNSKIKLQRKIFQETVLKIW